MLVLMKVAVLAVLPAGLLAACGPAGGAAKTEEEMASAIVESGGVLSLTPETLEQVIAQQLQSVAMERQDLTPEQQVKLSTEMRKQIEALLPELKKQMSGFLVESFEPKELKVIDDFSNAAEQEKIKQTMPAVTQMSIAAADAMTMKAVSEAIKTAGLDAAAAAPATPNPR